MSYYLLTNSSTLPSPLYVYLNPSGGASCGGMAAAWAVVIVIVVAAVVVGLDLCSMKLSFHKSISKNVLSKYSLTK